MKYAVGIDIGGTNTRVALINESYEIIERIQFLTDVDDPDKTMDKIVETISSFKLDIVGVLSRTIRSYQRKNSYYTKFTWEMA